jgi:DNA-binding CsgD family transcriptional regulator
MQETCLCSGMDDIRKNREQVLDGGWVPRCPACGHLSEHLSDDGHEQMEALFEETLHLLRALRGKLSVAYNLLGARCNEGRTTTPGWVFAGVERAPVLEEIGSKDSASRSAGLTPREVEVLRLVATGLTDAQVADQLFLSPRTVGAHLRSIRAKLGVGSRSAATRYAIERELV